MRLGKSSRISSGRLRRGRINPARQSLVLDLVVRVSDTIEWVDHAGDDVTGVSGNAFQVAGLRLKKRTLALTP